MCREDFKIVAVTARTLCRIPFLLQVEKLAAAGVDMLVLREKDLTLSEYRKLAEPVREICAKYGTTFIAHTYPEIAVDGGADGLQLPGALFAAEAEKLAETDIPILGTATHSLEEARFAEAMGADYITAGHIYPTDCKPGLAARGEEFLRSVTEGVHLPVFAIGGIDETNVKNVADCGAAGACFMSSMMRAEDPRAFVASLREAAK